MAKIEVVIDGDQVPAVRDLFIQAGAPATRASRASPGSVTTATTGRLLFNDRASLSTLITVVPENKGNAGDRDAPLRAAGGSQLSCVPA